MLDEAIGTHHLATAQREGRKQGLEAAAGDPNFDARVIHHFQRSEETNLHRRLPTVHLVERTAPRSLVPCGYVSLHWHRKRFGVLRNSP